MTQQFDVPAALEVLRRDLRAQLDARDALFVEAREHEATINRLLTARSSFPSNHIGLLDRHCQLLVATTLVPFTRERTH